MDLTVDKLADIYKSAAEELLEGISEENVKEFIKDVDTTVNPEVRKYIMNLINEIIHNQSNRKPHEAAKGLVKLKNFMTGDPATGIAGQISPEAIHPSFWDEFITEPDVWEELIEPMAEGEEPEGHTYLEFFILQHLLDFVAQDAIFRNSDDEEVTAVAT